VEAYRRFQARRDGHAFPAGEIRSLFEINADGSLGTFRTPPYVGREIDLGSIRKEYGGITVPVLALVAVQRPLTDQFRKLPPADEQERADKTRLFELEMQFVRRWESNLKKAVPDARIVEMPGAHHYLFLAEEAEILREIGPFLSQLQ
jgi:non-heme chloroperoxidase